MIVTTCIYCLCVLGLVFGEMSGRNVPLLLSSISSDEEENAAGTESDGSFQFIDEREYQENIQQRVNQIPPRVTPATSTVHSPAYVQPDPVPSSLPFPPRTNSHPGVYSPVPPPPPEGLPTFPESGPSSLRSLPTPPPSTWKRSNAYSLRQRALPKRPEGRPDKMGLAIRNITKARLNRAQRLAARGHARSTPLPVRNSFPPPALQSTPSPPPRRRRRVNLLLDESPHRDETADGIDAENPGNFDHFNANDDYDYWAMDYYYSPPPQGADTTSIHDDMHTQADDETHTVMTTDFMDSERVGETHTAAADDTWDLPMSDESYPAGTNDLTYSHPSDETHTVIANDLSYPSTAADNANLGPLPPLPSLQPPPSIERTSSSALQSRLDEMARNREAARQRHLAQGPGNSNPTTFTPQQQVQQWVARPTPRGKRNVKRSTLLARAADLLALPTLELRYENLPTARDRLNTGFTEDQAQRFIQLLLRTADRLLGRDPAIRSPPTGDQPNQDFSDQSG